MTEQEKQIYKPLDESTGIETNIDLPGIIVDELADPEELLDDFYSDNVEADIKARKNF